MDGAARIAVPTPRNTRTRVELARLVAVGGGSREFLEAKPAAQEAS